MAISVDLSNKRGRVSLIEDIESSENIGRKAESLRQVEIFNDRIFDHVYERLIRRFNRGTVNEMPVVSSINLARRIAKQEASIYKNPPERIFGEVSDQQIMALENIYMDMAINAKMLKSNEMFKLQSQNHIMIVPVNGQLQMRILPSHHIDKIDDDKDPETAAGYVISTVDKNMFRRNRRDQIGGTSSIGRYDNWTDQDSDFRDQLSGDPDDFLKKAKRYVVWTPEFNFIMNEKGEIVSGEDTRNIAGVIPIVEVSQMKDFEYWVRQGDSLSEFTIEYNSLQSSLAQVVMMQGFAQAYLIADDSVTPDNLQIGPNFVLKLPVDATGERPEFGFANPGGDISGGISHAEQLLASFLTSRGLDPSLVSGRGESQQFGSGVERLLSMVSQFEASRSDFDMYERAEKEIFNIVRAWHNASLGSREILDSKYQSSTISEGAQMFVKFAGPEMIKTDEDRLDSWIKKMQEGVASRVDMIMDLEGIEDRSVAIERLKEIEAEEMMIGGMNANITRGEDSNDDSRPGPGGLEQGSEDPSEE